MKVEIGQIICLYCSWNWRLWTRQLQLWSRCCYMYTNGASRTHWEPGYEV